MSAIELEPLIFELSKKGRGARSQFTNLNNNNLNKIPKKFIRKNLPRWPECSELDVVRHYTRLSQKNFSIDTANFYPLGSCTMKYNPRGVHKAAMLEGFANIHPLASEEMMQGTLNALYSLQEYLASVTGMEGVSLTPMAGSQGEYAGVAMIKAYHNARQDFERQEILIPDAAHGTNPASAVLCGYKVIELPTSSNGEIDLNILKAALSNKTAGIMLTNPSTLGLFMRDIEEIARLVHTAGGLLYYDGANLNAILGKIRPGDMGFDVMHLNLHKTFATPHGGGGPGSGPVAAGKRLKEFLPIPMVIKEGNKFRFATKNDYPNSIGRLSCFMGNAAILLRAYFYIRMLGIEGIKRVSEYATLNANYLLSELKKAGYTAAYPERRASHEFVLSLQEEKKRYGITAMDLAKRLLDYGFHAPTTYFPLLVPECLLIEPTETESKQTLDAFIKVMQIIRLEAKNNPELLKNAPFKMPVSRLDDVKAARELNLNYYK